MGNALNFYAVDAYDHNHETCEAEKFDKLFLKPSTQYEDTQKLTEITIINDDKAIHYENLKFFKDLKKLSITDPNITEIPTQATQLESLTELNFYQTYNPSQKFSITSINGISKLVNLKRLAIKMTTCIFPSEILELKNLQKLNLDTGSDIEVPKEICNMDNLFEIYINYPSSHILDELHSIIFNNRAIIKSWCWTTKHLVTELITDLKILNCDFDELVDLPPHIEILRLGIKVKNLPNLPVGLKELHIYNDLPYFTEDSIRLPFGCKLFLV
jgi:Leucine-rich repeat (LRR) protein